MVDLDSNPTKLIEIVEIGKQLLMTRGALTTFSIANDVAKYFAIIPAMFILAFPAARSAERDAAGHAGVRDPLGRDLQRASSSSRSSRSRCVASPTGRSARPRSCAGTCWSTGWAACSLPFVGIKAIDLLVVAVGLA